MKRWVLTLTAVLAVSASCTDKTVITAEQVLVLDDCTATQGGSPDGGAPDAEVTDAGGTDAAVCRPIADGVSLVTVSACVPDSIETRADPLGLTLSLSDGTWAVGSDPKVFTASLGHERCVSPSFKAPASTTSVHLFGTLVDFSRSHEIALRAAPLVDVALNPTPAALPASNAGMSMQLQATVHAETGQPTTGTWVAFTVTSTTPPNVTTSVYPPSARTDGNGGASATIVASADLVSVSVHAVATPPATPDAPAPPPVSADVTIHALP
jgi:hypothetical protein